MNTLILSWGEKKLVVFFLQIFFAQSVFGILSSEFTVKNPFNKAPSDKNHKKGMLIIMIIIVGNGIGELISHPG